MIIGVMSDTHEDRQKAIPHIIKRFKEEKVGAIIHCGDIYPQHLSAELFGNISVICALTDEQIKSQKRLFDSTPKEWLTTTPDKRIVSIDPMGQMKVYVGHKRSFEILFGSEEALLETMDKIRKEHDCVRYFFSGHTHRQVFMETGLMSFINPGAVEDSMGIAGGDEFVIIDTVKNKVVFSRIATTQSIKKKLKLAVISDSFDISEADPLFWRKLAVEFKTNAVTHIIHNGNLSLSDLAKDSDCQKQLKDFNVHYNLRDDQKNMSFPKSNWEKIPLDKQAVDIEGYRFYVQLDLGAKLLNKSEKDMFHLSLDIQKAYPETKFVLCGQTHDAFYEEGQNLVILNPGDIVKDRSYAIIDLPLTEITFSRIPTDPLPPL